MQIRNRTDLIRALRSAASLEHGVVCQYLFAACSLKSDVAEGGVTWEQLEDARRWKSILLRVAREEMEHLGLVCNLLAAVGAPPSFDPPRSGNLAESSCELLPFGETALERFVEIEAAHSQPEDGVGALYASVRAALERLERDGDLLFVGPSAAQVDNETVELPPGWYDFNLAAVRDLAGAIEAIDQITEASSGEHRHAEESHADAFRQIRDDFVAAQERDAGFLPVRPVATNPTLRLHGPDGLSVRHPTTRKAVEVYNAAYETMLAMLLRFYAPTSDVEIERASLRRIVFFPMMTMVLRPLGEMLTQMPLSEDGDGRTAGPTFEGDGDLSLRPDTLSAWTVLHERLKSLGTAAGELKDEVQESTEPWSKVVGRRFEFLHDTLRRLATNFEQQSSLKQARVQHLLGKMF